jgi:hypothetical protein
MKKTIYSSLIALVFLLSLAAIATAATTSLVGKKVQSTMSVELNGKTIKDAIVVDGVTYAPVRSLADVSGYKLSIKGGKVSMTSEVATMQHDPTINAAALQRIQFLKNEIESTAENIHITKSTSIMELEKKIAEQKAFTTDVAIHEGSVKILEGKLAGEHAYVAELQAKIIAANAEIAQLESQLK